MKSNQRKSRLFTMLICCYALIFNFSCTPKQVKVDHYSVQKENTIKEFYRIWDSADVAAFTKVISKDLIDHERKEKGDKSDFQNMIDAPLRIQAGFSKGKHIPLQVHYLKEDKVMVYWKYTAVHTGDFAGFPPTNNSISMKGVDIFQITEGLISEIWHVEAIHEMLAQIRSDSD
ncbi:MAG: ester cyclase [Saprospiraceae bacterium]|nr:ester cyclase [Saprospiraceae bacterium]